MALAMPTAQSSQFKKRLAIAIGLLLFVVAIRALAYTAGADEYGLDDGWDKAKAFFTSTPGVVMSAFIIGLGVVLLINSKILFGIFVIIVGFLLNSIPNMAEKAAGLLF